MEVLSSYTLTSLSPLEQPFCTRGPVHSLNPILDHQMLRPYTCELPQPVLTTTKSYLPHPLSHQALQTMADSKLVLVTGGSGFIALHVIHKLLAKGYRVRTTVRSLSRADYVRDALRAGTDLSAERIDAISFVEVDLLGDKGWDEATNGVDYVQHLASPFPSTEPEDENELIKPAREGTLRALRAAKKAGSVQRFVLTSSVVAINYGHAARGAAEDPFTEKDWSEMENPKSYIGAYPKSKTIAERAAWDWLAGEEGNSAFEMAAVNPVMVYGPTLGKGVNTSLEIPKRMLAGELPALPDIHVGVADVRDVADLHILAMESPKAAGQRYLAVSDEPSVSMKQMAADLKKGLPPADTRKVPSMSAPKIMLRIFGIFDKSVRLVVPEVGMIRPVSNAKAREELGWRPRSAAEAIVASAMSLKANGQV